MERNTDDMFGATGNVGSTSGGTSSMGTDAGMAGNTQPAGGLDYPAVNTSSTATVADQTTPAGQATATAKDAYGQLRDKTRNFQSKVADRLEQGAEKIRQRTHNAPLAGATGDGSLSVATEDRTKMQDSVVRGMEKSADWLRNGDLKADIEHQVRENPGRTLLIALGVGYLLGKTFRGGNR
jgi:ElaB/YqjD/DUF883 family membrane-anchored ribosome-binding protein